MTNITIVGTLHDDLDGPESLELLLNERSPTMVAVEFPTDFVLERKATTEETEEQKQLREKIQSCFSPREYATYMKVMQLEQQTMGYDITVPYWYCTTTRTSLFPIDSNTINQKIVPFVQEKKSREVKELTAFLNDKKALEIIRFGLTLGQEVFLQPRRAKTALLYDSYREMAHIREQLEAELSFSELSEFSKDIFRKIYDPQRDAFMAQRIREAIAPDPESLIAIVGVFHLPGLEMHLADLYPRTISLKEYRESKNP